MSNKEYNTSLTSKSDDELRTELLDLTREHFNLRMQLATGQLTQFGNLRRVKKNIARVKTQMSTRRISAQQAS